MKKPILKGYIYMILATLAFSNVYVFSKAALNELSLQQFIFLMFLFGFFINLGVMLVKGQFSRMYNSPRAILWIFPTLGAIEIFTVTTFYASVNAIQEPAVTGFLGNLFPIFTVILGMFFLHERFNKTESFGVAIVFAGAMLTGYSGELTWQKFLIPGVGLVVMNCLGAASATVLVRAKVNHLSPEILSFNRSFWLLLFASGWMAFTGQSLHISTMSLFNSFCASLLDPVLAILLAYTAYRYLEASRGTVIQSLKGILIVPFAYLYFATLPLPHQLAGGIITTIGVIVIALGQKSSSPIKQQIPSERTSLDK